MAASLKSFFDAAVVERLGAMVAAVHPPFRRRAFVAAATEGLSRLELLARARHVADALARALPADFEEAARILVASLGPELPAEGIEGQGMAPFLYLPHVILVGERGLDHFETAMAAQHAITRRFTAEWSIRPFLERHPEATLERLRAWARDPSPHVRRLVSEGTRPRLPWAPRLRRFQEDPRPGLALLDLLVDDPVLYVRRSVANHLGDVAKDHPALALATARRWLRARDTAERRWVVRHGLRHLVRTGHREALALLGYGGAPEVRLRSPRLSPARVAPGGRVAFEAEVEATGPRPQALAVGLAVHYVKADGRARPKVFRLRPLSLAPGARVRVTHALSLREMSTRRHHPGVHRVELVLNGVPFEAGAFRLVAGRAPRRPARAPVTGRER